MSTDYVSQWKDIMETSLTRQSFLEILDGKIPYILESQFLHRDVAKKLEDVLAPQLIPYLHATGPTLLKVGVAQFEFQALSEADVQNRPDNAKERYFIEVQKNKHLHDHITTISGQNVWQTVVDKLRSLFPEWDVVVADEGPGKEYFSGIFRSINDSTPIHCDWSPYDSRTEDWVINQVTKQAVFNLYLAPFAGGRTEIHDVQWTPDALKFRDTESYGYSSAIVEGRETATIEPKVGDLCLFNTRNMHQVFPVEKEEDPNMEGLINGKRARLTLSSFIGLLPQREGEKPRLILWS
ncbi:hypothetical protein BJ875DRAFT_408816 [Amylocarpus encephaloides]|uniref:Prolyl 4-hydroxylase alpha subunit Fe(2+) 2OG dioxygenase domain-containing protein n=1 Tax=Amylocarpus encephaloides TaxID=45428 RepID=A0A9P7YCI2_9HELO|nr:hypothetical protein BJ875DRAFT_408816 [Amylocarpus encephaloides]